MRRDEGHVLGEWPDARPRANSLLQLRVHETRTRLSVVGPRGGLRAAIGFADEGALGRLVSVLEALPGRAGQELVYVSPHRFPLHLRLQDEHFLVGIGFSLDGDIVLDASVHAELLGLIRQILRSGIAQRKPRQGIGPVAAGLLAD